MKLSLPKLNWQTAKKEVFLIVTLLLLALLWFQQCRHNASEREKNGIITELQLKNQKLDSIVNKYGQTILTQQSIVTSSQAAIKSLTDSVFSLKKKDQRNTEVIAYFKEHTNTVIQNKDIPYRDTVAMRKFSDSVNAQCQEVIRYLLDSTITVPRYVEDSSQFYTFHGEVKKESFRINHLLLPDTLQLRFVEHKGSLFRKSKTEVQFFHSNPLIHTEGSNSVVYKPKPKPRWLERIITVGVGAFIGYKIAH